MKKIQFNLNIGIIGSNESNRMKFLEGVKSQAFKEFEHVDETSYSKFLTIFNSIPIILKVFSIKNFDGLVNKYKIHKDMEVIILLIELDSLEDFDILQRQKMDEINELFLNNIVFILVGIDSGDPSKISDIQLIEKAKELNVFYCFKIYQGLNEVMEVIETILKDFIFKYRYTSPELFAKALSYGKQLEN
ncbi:MAG: hypothetical protein P8Y70_16410 [Candidatus Lokiarchaeota archaeon]